MLKREEKSIKHKDWELSLRRSKDYNLTPCRPDGLLITYPQFPDVLNTLNVRPHNIFLLTV
jgi:hypothetical protein